MRQVFPFLDRGDYLEPSDVIPEPHAFTAAVQFFAESGKSREYLVPFEEQAHGHHDGAHGRDNNMRAAFVHVMADAAVSLLVIVGLLLARTFGWLWMDPVAGLVGAVVIASWSLGLLRDTGAILLDMTPDAALADRMRKVIEADGDRLIDLHLWRLGPGHLGAIVSLVTDRARGPDYYRKRLAGFGGLSHLTIEVGSK